MLSQKIIPLVFLLLSACNYHLRGDIELATGAETIYLEAGSDTLRQEISNTIKFSSAAKLVNSPSEAAITLKIAKESLKSWVLSMNAAGRSNELQLIYQLSFSMFDAKGKQLLDEQNIKVKREYFNDQAAILGKTNEEMVIRGEMYKQAASSIIGRINMALEANNKAKSN
jgi:LPS-assembly lipoprotein